MRQLDEELIVKKLLVMFALLALPAAAQWKENGKPLPDQSWRKSSGKFGVMLLIADEPEKFIEDWQKPEMPTIHTIDIAERGRPIAAFVLFVGCREVSGVCNSSVDFTVLRPDGSEYANHKGAELWSDKPAPADGVIQLSLANLGIKIEPDDPAGKYRVKAVAHDLNASRDIEVAQEFTVPK